MDGGGAAVARCMAMCCTHVLFPFMQQRGDIDDGHASIYAVPQASETCS